MTVANYSMPGIYRVTSAPPSPEPIVVRTDIAGFVGFAERGPLPVSPAVAVNPLFGAPTPAANLPFDPSTLAIQLNSWQDYRNTFGGMSDTAYLAYAVRAFFENGGARCYVVRVAGSDPSALPQTSTLTVPADASPAGPSTTLTAGVQSTSVDAGGETTLSVSNSQGLSAGDSISVGKIGCAETMSIVAVPDAKTLQVKRGKMPINHATGAVVSKTAATTGAVSATATSIAAYGIEAASPGSWGNRIHVQITPISQAALLSTNSFGAPATVAAPLIALSVRIDPSSDSQQIDPDEIYQVIALTTQTEPSLPNVLNVLQVNSQSKLIRIRIPGDDLVGPGDQPVPVTAATASQQIVAALAGGTDGLNTLTVSDFTGGPSDYRGLRVLQELSDVTILCAPDAVNTAVAPLIPRKSSLVADPCAAPAVSPASPSPAPAGLPSSATPLIYQAMVNQCQQVRNRVAILDTSDGLEPQAVAAYVQSLGIPGDCAPFAALYYPWIQAPDSLTGDPPVWRVPPSGHLAGVYATFSLGAGVQFAPANVELNFAVDVGKQISDAQHGNLNNLGINAIRCLPGRGIRVLGARSMATMFADLSVWTFIHVRRVFSWIEDSVLRAMQWTVFESNDFNLRTMITHALNVFLERIWMTGALQGDTKDQAYYVVCNDTNNPQASIDDGQLLCQIGLAVAEPMEFIQFNICRSIAGMQVIEA
jgi:uncharacterized protein